MAGSTLQQHQIAMAELIREAGFGAGEHPAPEVLSEYLDGLLSAGEKAELQDHLALCPECTDMFLEMAGISEPAAGIDSADPVLSEERAHVLWPALRRRLNFQPQESFSRPFFRSEQVAWALAATLLLTTVLASTWSYSRDRGYPQSPAPAVNIAVLDLVPIGQAGVVREIEASDPLLAAEQILLVLNLADLRPFDGYRAELTDSAGGNVIWANDDLRRSPSGNFTIQLPAAMLGDRNKIELFGLSADGREKLAQYEIPFARRQP